VSSFIPADRTAMGLAGAGVCWLSAVAAMSLAEVTFKARQSKGRCGSGVRVSETKCEGEQALV
jgi:hypothetical protein